MAPSREHNAREEPRAPSSSPATRRQPIHVREELPSRITRRSSTLSSRDHRIPIECPLPSCDATTVHQHYDNLQFFNPHPAKEVRCSGYASSHRVTSSQPNVEDEGPTLRGQETFGPEISDEAATQEQDGMGQTSVTDDAEIDDEEEPVERRTLIITLKVAAPKGGVDTQRPMALAITHKEQQDIVILDGAAEDEYTMMDEAISDLSPCDPITSRRTLDFVEDVVTPLRTIPMDIGYETIANAWDSRRVQEEPEEIPSTTSPGMQSVFDEWLVTSTTEHGTETLLRDIQLDDPLHHLSREDGDCELPSNIMRPS